jgi:hypothetical protein
MYSQRHKRLVEKLNRSELIDIVYTWHTARPQKLQIPSQSPIIHHDQMNK